MRYIIDEINVNVTFLLAKILAWPNFVANAMKQKKSEEQKLLTNNNGNNWYGNDLILHLIHTLDETEIWCSYMIQQDLSNEHVVLNKPQHQVCREEGRVRVAKDGK